MLIDGGKSLVPYWLVAAAGRPTEEVRLDTGKRFEDLWRGGWDPVARLLDQDRDGVAAEVIYPSVGMLLCNYPDIDYQHACFEAYNRWIAEFCLRRSRTAGRDGPDRVRTPAGGDRRPRVDQGARPTRRDVAGDKPTRPPTTTTRCTTSSGTPWSISAAPAVVPHPHEQERRAVSQQRRGVRLQHLHDDPAPANQDIVGLMIFGAVFERHPGLRIVCVEADAGWAPHWMYRADHAYDRHRNWPTVKNYLVCRANSSASTCTSRSKMTGLRSACRSTNSDRLMWANDFPHSDATWPNSQEMLAEHVSQLTGCVRSRILHDNAAELYSIPL